MLLTLAHEIFFTAILLKQGYHKLRKAIQNSTNVTKRLVSNFNTGLKSLLKQGQLEPEFYGGLVCKFRKIVGRNDFSDQLRKNCHAL